jgi:hypothetical protein
VLRKGSSSCFTCDTRRMKIATMDLILVINKPYTFILNFINMNTYIYSNFCLILNSGVFQFINAQHCKTKYNCIPIYETCKKVRFMSFPNPLLFSRKILGIKNELQDKQLHWCSWPIKYTHEVNLCFPSQNKVINITSYTS